MPWAVWPSHTCGLSHCLQGGKSEAKGSAGSASSETPVLGLLVPSAFSVCHQVVSHVRLCPNLFLEDASHVGLEPTQMISFYLNYLCQDSLSKCSHVLRSKLGVRTSTSKFWGVAGGGGDTQFDPEWFPRGSAI